ncbi:N-6 DNA methylase [Peptoniphilus sp. SGI.035]|uniref:N-6 DNA methylase n=1 Tax=Peptoniphilus sp. SGI.035 TaxID=3420564 RepID=UPI003D078BEE
MKKDFSAKAYRNDLKEKGVFHTDSKLAEIIKSYGKERPKNVYDPTCGVGTLLSVFDEDIPKYGQELTEEYLKVAEKTLKNFTGEVGDTLKNPAFMDMKFDLIVANYPFSIKWEPDKEDVRFKDWVDVPPPSKADYAFIMHMIYLLADDGVCVSLNFPGILYRKAREGKIRKELVERGYVKKVIQVPSGYFEDTNIETTILVLSKEKFKGSIKFVNLKDDLERDVQLEEIAENDYNLSVSSYVQKEIEVEEIDPIELRETIRNKFIQHVDDNLGIELFLTETFEDKKARLDLLKFYKKVLEVVEKHILNLKEQIKKSLAD